MSLNNNTENIIVLKYYYKYNFPFNLNAWPRIYNVPSLDRIALSVQQCIRDANVTSLFLTLACNLVVLDCTAVLAQYLTSLLHL